MMSKKKSASSSDTPKTFREFQPWFSKREAKLAERMNELEGSCYRVICELGRALLLSGNGERFTPSIEAAIRSYAIANEELERAAGSEDAAMGFLRIRTEADYSLAVLGVTKDEVPVGTPVNKELHLVTRQASTNDASLLHTVSKCLLPQFSWIDGEGNRAWRPAKVEAFTELVQEQEPNESIADVSCEADSALVVIEAQ